MADGAWHWQTVLQTVVAGTLLGILGAIAKFVRVVIGLDAWRKRHEQHHATRENKPPVDTDAL